MEKRLKALLRLAIKHNASDIHFGMNYDDVNIYMRINGGMRKVKSLSGDNKLIRYLQYKANLDIGNMTVPQTGQFEMEIDNNILSLRFAIVNSLNNANAVLRILNNRLRVEAKSLSRNSEQNAYLSKLLDMPNGLIMISGATGSGKTTSLYALLKNAPNKVIYTIEDPIEVYNDNLIQLQINEKIGFDYEEGIKQILRHDPDIIMIGEIRDDKAAKMALRAANTGHLVLATIHASNASSCISRMVDLGVSEAYLYEMLVCLINQRMINEEDKYVVYEIMDKEEIEYFRKEKKNSPSFLSIDKQLENKGVYFK
ncbi:MAG: ATPase, T2SS/T4P/T4SS family [Erysipelotrichaceae bacterium]|nr:ATPase, T2SS/T4P/T4SS family [Erysipelotrichaceae bacterium]